MLESKNKYITSARAESENALLNGLRGMSVVMIMVYHCFMLPVLAHFRSEPHLLHNYLAGIPNYLQFIFGLDKAVDIFFLLSAHLLCSQLLRELSTHNRINFRHFYIRRFFRIIPIYAVGLFLYAFITPEFSSQLLHNLLFIDNFYHDSIIPVGWSLSIEVQFYLILPFVVLLMNYMGRYKAILLLSLFFISFIVRYAICLGNPELTGVAWTQMLNDPDDVFDAMTLIYTPTHARYGPLVLGMAWAYLNRNHQAIAYLNRLPKLLVRSLFVLAVASIVLTLEFPAYQADSWVYSSFGTEINIWWLTIHRNLFAGAVLVVVILLEHTLISGWLGSRLQGLLENKYWRIPAQLSFPLYLFQFPTIFVSSLIVFWTADYTTIHHFGLTDVLLIFVVATVLTSGFSLVLHKWIEKPMIRKGKALTLHDSK